ncbi:MAG: peptide-methionine (R)-S-oxide reductase MsrB [Iamia sp.]
MTDASSPTDPGAAPIPSDEDLRARLTPVQYEVTQREGTERAFSGEYWDAKEPGTYHCVVCEEPLFRSEVKYDSGTGWPSFWEAVDPAKVTLIQDRKMFMRRTEVQCARCGAHLGHVFPDGPQPSGDRYCMNSASLSLVRDGADNP